ncbi:helix-turn-helix transcriptional regulator [Bradyrhizobium sp. Tv2a-2]|uniref:helix-turn-helix transcriptional regulator n=1 Tax=Bradyrhizobium sp. Tv2a-2 TaxID=113395 RepID=UPI0003F63EFC|nr:helix-turn-helix transcriptional regulator [Bradyrhizobium sp. Tv2a-2]
MKDIIDHIYEAAADPDLWPGLLDLIAARAGAVGSALCSVGEHGTRWTASPTIAPVFSEYVKDGWIRRDPRIARAAALSHVGFLSDYNLFTPEEIERDSIYGYLRGKGLGWWAGTVLTAPAGGLLALTIDRAFERGPIEDSVICELNLLRPHLARAVLLSARFGLQRARGAAEAFTNFGRPAAVLSRKHTLLAANSRFNSLVPEVFRDGRDRVHLVPLRADRLLANALREFELDAAEQVRSLPLPACGSQPPMIIHLVPVGTAEQDIFEVGSCLLAASAVVPSSVPSADLIQGLFDLTPAEARVACGIAAGKTVDALASNFAVSSGTIRVQLRSVFEKTATTRQAQLVQLLAESGLANG